MTETAARLQRAILAWPSGTYTQLGPRARPTVRSFSRLATEAAPGSGSSRGMLARYFADGPDTPEVPDPLLRTAAKLLGVRLQWLRLGEGAMTALAEKQRARLTDRVVVESGERLLDPFERSIEWGTVEGYALLDLVYQWDGVLHPGARTDNPARYRTVTDLIMPILDAPFAALGLEPDTVEKSPAFSRYARAMLLALSLAPAAGKPLTKENNNDDRKDT